MKLTGILIPTTFAREGMKVRDVFTICLEAGVPALPYINSKGKRRGYISLAGIMHHGCLPNYMVELANVLGNHLSCFDDARTKIRDLMEHPIEHYIEKPLRSITSETPVVKAVAILEKYDSNYLFVYDGDNYRGVVTAEGIAQRMLEIDSENQ
ncbi:MAG: CBS domain-containing protein [Pseudomonadota bacterium]